MKNIILTILCVLYCSPVHAMASGIDRVSFEEVTLCIMIPDEDDISIYYTSINGENNGGVIFQIDEEGLYVEQNISAIADPPKIFAEIIRDIIEVHLMIYLDFENGWDKFETLGKITKMEGY